MSFGCVNKGFKNTSCELEERLRSDTMDRVGQQLTEGRRTEFKRNPFGSFDYLSDDFRHAVVCHPHA